MRALNHVEAERVRLEALRTELGVTDEVAALEALSPAMLVALGEKGVKTLDDFADLASDELLEILPADSMDEDTANDLIMAARAHWFDDEDAPATTGEEEETEPTA